MTEYDSRKDSFESFNVAIGAMRAKLLAERCPAAKRVEVIGDCELYLGDCMEIMPALERVAAVVTDPPYGLGKRMQGGTWGAKDEMSGFLKWDLEIEQRWIDTILALSVPSIVWGANYFEVPASRCWLIWNKINSVPTMADMEMAWTSFDRPAKRFDAPVGRVEFGHPTSKPLPLMQWCLSFLPLGGGHCARSVYGQRHDGRRLRQVRAKVCRHRVGASIFRNVLRTNPASVSAARHVYRAAILTEARTDRFHIRRGW